MFFETAAFIVDAMHELGPNAMPSEIGKACRSSSRTARRHLAEMEQHGLVICARASEGGHRKWTLTARGEALRQALKVSPCHIGQICGIEVAVLREVPGA